MSGYQTILFCTGIVTAVFFFSLLFLNEKDDKFKVLKKFTLVAMVSTGLFISLYLVFGYSEYKVEKDDAGIAILGVLATVWVGLNIYNVIEKREVDDLKEELRNSLEGINELRKDLRESKDEMDKKLYDVEKNSFIQNTFTMCSMKKNNNEEINYINRVIRRYPNEKIGYLYRAFLYTEEKKYEEAINDFSKVIELDDKYIYAYFDRGNAYGIKEIYDKALSDFSKVIELDNKHIKAYLLRGMLYVDKKMHDEALSDFNKVIELDDKHIKAYLLRGMLYVNKKMYDEALNDFEEVLNLDKDNEEAMAYKNLIALKLSEEVY
ncbi:tetratricopeptide repeat protein [Clostridioides difficile]